MVLKKSKIKIPYIRLNFRIVRQSDARWCERTAVNHRLLLDWVCSVAVGSLISRAGFFFPGLIFTGPATVTEFLFIAGGTYTVSAGAAVIFRRTGKRNLCFFVILFLHKVSLSFI